MLPDEDRLLVLTVSSVSRHVCLVAVNHASLNLQRHRFPHVQGERIHQVLMYRRSKSTGLTQHHTTQS